MAFNADYFLSKTLGEDFFESLTKFELWKPGTRTTVDHEEIKTALMIVPRTIMALLIRELTPMQVNETKEISLPVNAGQSMVRLTKHERDVYSGEIFEDNKMIVDFKYRSIPGIGLVIMSAFELYDTEKLAEEHKQAPAEDITKKVQHLIDERIALHDLIGRVVDKKIEERDAIKQLLMAKLSEALPTKEAKVEQTVIIQNEVPMAKSSSKKESPLKGFLDKRKNKSTPTEFNIQMAKGEHVDCPDCKKNIFDGQVFSGCICLGDDMDKKIYIKKTEDGVKMRFGRGWDPENIEMLLEVLRSKRG
ncbi:MAG: hypothetical protein HC840_00240 [Leptolyngbyaceae cyanobacterium RM2_2_4]|nr:hypothetical protein [Leptolyngbyaceae cyanobacterium RM2_2_4]